MVRTAIYTLSHTYVDTNSRRVVVWPWGKSCESTAIWSSWGVWQESIFSLQDTFAHRWTRLHLGQPGRSRNTHNFVGRAIPRRRHTVTVTEFWHERLRLWPHMDHGWMQFQLENFGWKLQWGEQKFQTIEPSLREVIQNSVITVPPLIQAWLSISRTQQSLSTAAQETTCFTLEAATKSMLQSWAQLTCSLTPQPQWRECPFKSRHLSRTTIL